MRNLVRGSIDKRLIVVRPDPTDFQREFTVATFGKPDALVFKEKHKSTISAWVCGQCGYLELYADSPSSLKLPKA
jgi:hypothetical protein